MDYECSNLNIIYFIISYLQRKSDDANESTESIVYILFTTDSCPYFSYKIVYKFKYMYVLFLHLYIPTGDVFITTTCDLLCYVVFPEDDHEIWPKHLGFTFKSKLVQ